MARILTQKIIKYTTVEIDDAERLYLVAALSEARKTSGLYKENATFKTINDQLTDLLCPPITQENG